MENIWVLALGSVILISLISLVGVFTLTLKRKFLTEMVFVLVSLSVGALFGDVFLHILPEVFESGLDPTKIAGFVMLGLLTFFVLEKFFRWGHCHNLDLEETTDVHHHHPVGYLNLIADGLHNFIDGLVIGITYLTNPAVGLATTLAVIFHEIPQEIGDFGVLIHAGFSNKKALMFNLGSALLSILGVVIALVIGGSIAGLAPYALALAAGGFIYIAGSDLVPELHKVVGVKNSLVQLMAIILGLLVMFTLTLLE